MHKKRRLVGAIIRTITKKRFDVIIFAHDQWSNLDSFITYITL